MTGSHQHRQFPRLDEQSTPNTTEYQQDSLLCRLHPEETDVHMNTEQRREEVSQTTVAARGLPCPAFAWKGMGPSGYHKPPDFSRSSNLGFIILFSCFLMSVASSGTPLGLIRDGDVGGSEMSSFGGGSATASKTCNLKPCMDDYSVAQSELFNRDPALRDTESICAALREYKRCIMTAKGCHADLMYHTVRTLYRKQERDNGCSDEAEEDKKKSEKSKIDKDGDERGESKTYLPPPAMCVYQGPQVYRHCGLFGDPHLRTFYGEFQTCKVEGAWPLVNNDYVTVQVTNDPVEGNPGVTATSTLTVIVKGNGDCTSPNFLQYQAQSDSLPGTFDDGQVRVGPYRSLELVEVDPGAHVEIHIRYINTVVVVRRIGTYLTFSIQMPESLINGSSGALGGSSGRGFSASAGGAASFRGVQLCLRGCPEPELINFQDYLASRRDSLTEEVIKPSSTSDGDSMDNLQGDGGVQVGSVLSRAKAEDLCREASVVGFYFDFCVFDLMATGDRNFTLSAVSAMQDALRLDPSSISTLDNRTSLEKYDQQFYRGAASHNASCIWRTSFLTLAVFLAKATGVVDSRRQRPHVVFAFVTVLTLLLLMR